MEPSRCDDLSVGLLDRPPLPRTHRRELVACVCMCVITTVGIKMGVGQGITLLAVPPPQATATARMASISKTVLVTGYGSFGNNTRNPAELVAMLLDGQCVSNACFIGRVLPVDRSGAALVASELLAAPVGVSRYDAIVHLGLESSSKGLRIETVAANVLAKELSDGGGAWSAEVPCNKSEPQLSPAGAGGANTTAAVHRTPYEDIFSDAPCLLATTAPLNTIDLLGDAGGTGGSSGRGGGPSELWSRDAGTYYCNEIYFRTLWAIRTRRLAPRSRAGDGRLNLPGGPLRLLPAVFIHLPTEAASPAAVSADIVRRLAALLVGSYVPGGTAKEDGLAQAAGGGASTLLVADPTAAALGAALRGYSHRSAVVPVLTAASLPHGFYSGSQAALGESVSACVHVTAAGKVPGAVPTAVGGRMDFSATVGPLAPASFTCRDEAWSATWSASAHGGAESSVHGAGASSTAATVDIMVEGDACWEQNVAANVDELSVRYDPASDSIRLSGSHRVTAFWSVSLSAVLTPVRECGAS